LIYWKDAGKYAKIISWSSTAVRMRYVFCFSEPPLPPTQLFDDLFFIGTKFVGVLISKTTDGLMMIDSMNYDADASNVIIPGMQELGLNP
jgi:hypothetical protein